MSFQLTSTAFRFGETIPINYTCDGDDVSPPLKWTGSPEGTVSYALIADDPDAPAGTWDHWVLFNIPASTDTLEELFPFTPEIPDGTRTGRNSWGRFGYNGPCPPSGTHRYFFSLYALDTVLDLEAGATSRQLRQAMEGHILKQTVLMGEYSRK
jgi:Raf kinase inhibitor-like YbhB/YbcL family protein